MLPTVIWVMREAISPAGPAKGAHILIVDDDRRLRELLGRYLTETGFRTTAAADAKEAREAMARIVFDLIVLDIMLPGESGIELSAALRTNPRRTPVLLLTAMAEPEDRVRGLETGAEDYMVKPFEPRELVLRITTILRRRGPPAGMRERLRFGPLVYDPRRATLAHDDGDIRKLTSAEAALLAALALRAGETVSREELAAMSASAGRAVDVQVARIRRKLEPDPKEPRFLVTVWGRGYALRPD